MMKSRYSWLQRIRRTSFRHMPLDELPAITLFHSENSSSQLLFLLRAIRKGELNLTLFRASTKISGCPARNHWVFCLGRGAGLLQGFKKTLSVSEYVILR